MKKIILCHLLLASYACASQIETNESYHPLFKKHPSLKIQQILNEERITPVPPPSGQQDVGFNMPQINLAHQQILETCTDQRILEVGPGSGYFMGKLLAAGASHVTGIELSLFASRQIPQIIETYEPTKGAFQNKYKIINENVCKNGGEVIKTLQTTYDQVIGMNLLHYLTPIESILFLSFLKPIMNENTLLTFSMNTPTGIKSTCDAYAQALKDTNNNFPGYLKRTRIDTQIYQTKNLNLIKLLQKSGTEFINAQPLSYTTNTSPSQLTIVGAPTIEHIGNNTAQAKIKIEQTAFTWDKQTAIYAFQKAGLMIKDMYYLDSFNTKYPEVDLAQQHTTLFNLVVTASLPKKRQEN